MFILYFASSTTLRTKLYPRIQTKNISYRKSFDLAERIDKPSPSPPPIDESSTDSPMDFFLKLLLS